MVLSVMIPVFFGVVFLIEDNTCWQYITWISDNTVSWTLNAAGMAADTTVEIGPRPVSQEPMVRPPKKKQRSSRLTDRTVFGRELGHVRGLFDHRLCRFGFPGTHARGLHTGVPAKGQDQHRVRPQ